VLLLFLHRYYPYYLEKRAAQIRYGAIKNKGFLLHHLLAMLKVCKKLETIDQTKYLFPASLCTTAKAAALATALASPDVEASIDFDVTPRALSVVPIVAVTKKMATVQTAIPDKISVFFILI
jgi:hypothetical protein